MSVFGGDSWAREARQRKRRVDDLMLPSSPRFSDASSPSFKKLSNGKYACLICAHNPILDTPLMLSIHNKGSRHIAAESRMRTRELSRQEELNKRIALLTDSTGLSSSSCSVLQLKGLGQDKPLLQQTSKAILEAQCNQVHNQNDLDLSKFVKTEKSSCVYPSINVAQESGKNDTKPSAKSTVDNETLNDWHVQLRERKELELKFTAAGWKRDCHGKWYRDENVEFDSDEEDPNICLN